MSPGSPGAMSVTSEAVEKEEKEVKTSIKDLYYDKVLFRNLLVCLFLWVAASFDYFLINFQLKYIEGDIYVNTIVSSVSEILAYLISGALYEIIGPKISFVASFIIAIIGSVFYIIFGETYKSLIPLMILSAKFGISGAFNGVYLANGLFPAAYASTTFGICNFFARLASMLAP